MSHSEVMRGTKQRSRAMKNLDVSRPVRKATPASSAIATNTFYMTRVETRPESRPRTTYHGPEIVPHPRKSPGLILHLFKRFVGLQHPGQGHLICEQTRGGKASGTRSTRDRRVSLGHV